MPNDSVMVALMADALGASTLSRRIAASLLLDVLHGDSRDQLSKGKLETVEATATPDVVKELRTLIDEHGLREVPR